MKYPLTFKGNPNGPRVGVCSFCGSKTGSNFMTLNGGSLVECSPFLSICSHHDDYAGLGIVESYSESQYEFYFCNAKCLRGFFNRIIDDLESREDKRLADQETLKKIADILSSSSEVEIKGEGDSAFVHAKSSRGSIEFSCNNEDSYWVEYFSSIDSEVVGDRTFYSTEEALESIEKWLGSNEI